MANHVSYKEKLGNPEEWGLTAYPLQSWGTIHFLFLLPSSALPRSLGEWDSIASCPSDSVGEFEFLSKSRPYKIHPTSDTHAVFPHYFEIFQSKGDGE